MVAQLDKKYLRHRRSKAWPRLIAYLLFEGRPLTTRGQWINPVLGQFHKLITSLPALKTVRAPIFIIGTGRSGTTVLGKILSIHKDIGFLNEPKILWHAALGNEDLIGSYGDNPAILRMDRQDVTPDARRRIHKLHGAFLRLAGARRLVDKYPELVFRTDCVLGLYKDAKFVFISRDGADTAASIRLWSQRLGESRHGERHDWWGRNDRKWHALVDQAVASHPDLYHRTQDIRDIGDHALRAAIEWVLSMQEGLTLQDTLPPDQFLHVSYESLCADPAPQIARILTFAELAQDKTCLTYASSVLAPVKPYAAETWPDWFTPIFNKTQARLDGRASAATATERARP